MHVITSMKKWKCWSPNYWAGLYISGICHPQAQAAFHWIKQNYFRIEYYEACPENKDISRVGRQGNFFCLLWQHYRRSWSFICELFSFDSGRTGFVWVRRVWNGSADPKSRQMRGAFRHRISQRKRWTSSGNLQTNCCWTSHPAISTCFFT